MALAHLKVFDEEAIDVDRLPPTAKEFMPARFRIAVTLDVSRSPLLTRGLLIVTFPSILIASTPET